MLFVHPIIVFGQEFFEIIEFWKFFPYSAYKNIFENMLIQSVTYIFMFIMVTFEDQIILIFTKYFA